MHTFIYIYILYVHYWGTVIVPFAFMYTWMAFSIYKSMKKNTNSHPWFFMAAIFNQALDARTRRKIVRSSWNKQPWGVPSCCKLIAGDGGKNNPLHHFDIPKMYWECGKTTWTNGKSFVKVKVPTSTVYVKPSISKGSPSFKMVFTYLPWNKHNTTESKGFNDGFLIYDFLWPQGPAHLGFNQPAFSVGWGWPKPCP